MKENFNRRLHRLHNSDLVAEMYYCGSLEKPTRIPEILKHGFSEEGNFTSVTSEEISIGAVMIKP